MSAGPVNLAAIRATQHRATAVGATAAQRRHAIRTAILAMRDGASPARAYADACTALRLRHLSTGPAPKGAA